VPLSEDPTALQGALLAEAFHLLLSSGRLVPRATLARAVRCGEAAVDEALAGLERIGRTRRSAAGEVLGSLGLSIEPSPHELLLEVGRRYTWCALDAVGILGALDSNGRIRLRQSSNGRAHRDRLRTGAARCAGRAGAVHPQRHVHVGGGRVVPAGEFSSRTRQPWPGAPSGR
jgi:hypothetical protein